MVVVDGDGMAAFCPSNSPEDSNGLLFFAPV